MLPVNVDFVVKVVVDGDLCSSFAVNAIHVLLKLGSVTWDKLTEGINSCELTFRQNFYQGDHYIIYKEQFIQSN